MMTECLFELCPCPQFKSQEDHKAVEIELRVRATTRAQEAGIFTTNPHTGFEVSSSLSLSLSLSILPSLNFQCLLLLQHSCQI